MGLFTRKNNPLRAESKRLNERIKTLQKEYKRMEFKGCHGDKDLLEKQQALEEIRREILELESRREKLWARNVIHHGQVANRRPEKTEVPASEAAPERESGAEAATEETRTETG